jgi:hypothetical protein
MSKSQMCWAWGTDAPMGRETAEFLRPMHPKSLQHHVWYVGYAISVRTNGICERFLVFLIVGCLGSVEVSWASEIAGNTHSKQSLARLLMLRVCSFCSNWCGAHIRSIWLGQRLQQGYNSAIAAKHAFFAMTEYEPTCSKVGFSVRNRYAPRFHARMCGPRVHELCAKCFLSCRFMICERSAGPRMISRFEHKSLLVRGSVCLFLCKACHNKEGICFEGLHVSKFGT